MSKTTCQRQGVLGKEYMDMSMGSLCSPKNTHHRRGSQQPSGQYDPSHQPGLLSTTRVPGSTVRGPGNLGL